MMKTTSTGFKLCLTTVNKESKARELAQLLLQQKLVACVNISSPLLSLYHWQGELIEEQEFLLQMKTSEQKISLIEAALEQHHPYEVPELIVINIESGATNYLNWINESLS